MRTIYILVGPPVFSMCPPLDCSDGCLAVISWERLRCVNVGSVDGIDFLFRYKCQLNAVGAELGPTLNALNFSSGSARHLRGHHRPVITSADCMTNAGVGFR